MQITDEGTSIDTIDQLIWINYSKTLIDPANPIGKHLYYRIIEWDSTFEWIILAS